MTNANKPPETTMVTSAAGLLNLYEYNTVKTSASSEKTYLDSGLNFWLITPYSNTNHWVASHAGGFTNDHHYLEYGLRPSIVLKSSASIVDGNGTSSNPYRLKGDNDKDLKGKYLNTRYSGEYVRFGNSPNDLYRIVSKENGYSTKITSAQPLKNERGTTVTSPFGNSVIFSSSNLIGTFFDDQYIPNYLSEEDRNMIENNTVWYLGTVDYGQSYKLAKYSNVNMSSLTSVTTKNPIGLLRLGEQLSGLFEREPASYFTLTPYDEDRVRNPNTYGGASGDYYTAELGIKPALNIKANAIISSGTGTLNDPFVITLEDDDNRVKTVTNSGAFAKYLKYEDGTYAKEGDKVKIVSALNNNYVIDLYNGATTNGTNVQLYQNNNSEAQKFIFKASTNNYYNIAVSSVPTRGLDVYNGLTTPGTNIQIYDLSSYINNSQRWGIIDAGNGYYYIKSALGTCVDIHNASASNGANIQTYTCNYSNAQKWKFVKVN